MTTRTRRRVALGMGLVAAPVLAASMSYACVSLATLSMSTGSGTAGATVSGTGTGFSGMMGTVGTNVPDTPIPVEIHFGTRSGDVVWTGLPNGTGQINFSFQLPQVPAGQHIVFATQTAANGNAVGGTPARAVVEVLATPAPIEAVALAPETPAAPIVAAPVAVPAPAAAPRVARVTPAPAAVTPAPVAAPAPVVAAPVAAPVPEVVAPIAAAPAPAPVAAPAPAEARRSVMVSMAGESSGSPWLAIGLVGLGLVLSLGATALVVAGRRESKAPATARR